MKKIELLAPAGDFDKLKTAIHFGADAVYMAGPQFGLRKASKNFSLKEIKKAVKYAHEHQVKIYITMNIIAHNEDLENMKEYIKEIISCNIDALIIADAGIFDLVREVDSTIPIHISTQASITNYRSAKFWHHLGAFRIVFSREINIEDIREIKEYVPDLEIETFVHGAMCISYSGRCLLSNYLTDRNANHGDCAQSCRWNYQLVEKTREGEYFPIEEDERGTYIFNSKDLCMIDSIDQLIENGVDSFKIEGRVKGQYYVATVVRAYRIAIDAYYDGKYTDELKKELLEEIKKASYRDFTHGFYYDKPDENSQLYQSASYIREYDFIGEILEVDEATGLVKMEHRNRFFPGEEIEIFGKDLEYYTIQLDEVFDENLKPVEVANQVQSIYYFYTDQPLKKHQMIRRKKIK